MNSTTVSALTFSLAVMLAGLFAGPVAAAGRKPHVDPALKRHSARSEQAPVRVIIQARAGKAAGLAAKFEGRMGAKQHRSIGAVSASVSPEELGSLLQDDSVDVVSLDMPVGSHFAPEKFRRVEDTRLDSGLGSVLLTDGPWSGRGVGVAVIDSGIANHPDFGRRITAFYDFTGSKPVRRRAPLDPYGHGTFVAGLIGGSGNRTRGEASGIAPDVHFIGLRVLDETGQGMTSDVIDAINFAIEHKDELGIDILNLSVGHPVTDSAWADPLVSVVENAVRAGLIVVTSAGNFGKNPETGEIGFAGISSPGNAPSAITVGAANTMRTATPADDVVADFSSRGPTWVDRFAKPDVVAPGYRLVATATAYSYIYKNHPTLRFRSVTGRKMLMMSGTSGSAAVVSGVVARMIEANRTLAPSGTDLPANAAKMILQYTAVLLADPAREGKDEPYYHPLIQGAGLINAPSAIAVAGSFDLKTPTAMFTQTPFAAIAVDDAAGATETWEWGQRIIWGDTVLFGQRIIWGDTMTSDVTTGQRIIWGDSLLTALCTNVRWGSPFLPDDDSGILDNDFVNNPGDSPISDGLIWADNLVWGNVQFGSNLQFGDSVAWRDNLVLSESIVWGNIRGR